ncbi:RAP [Symbiodinium sp. CCMP2456]|nr:RAP [Symbiodinium sp. CCMP2456]
MAKLDLRLHKLVTDEALQKLPEFEPQQLVNMMWSYATLRSDAPLSDMAGALRGRISSLAPLGRANLCWAVAKLQVREEWLLRELVQECQSAIPEMNGQNLANTSWALATLRVADDRFFESVAKVVAAQCGEFAQQNISNTAWAFAKLQIKRPDMMAAISRCVQQRAVEMPPQGIANTAWSFATLNIRDDGLMWGVQAALVVLCVEVFCPLQHFMIPLAALAQVTVAAMAAFRAGDAFMDDVRAAQTQIRSLLGADDDVSGSEWFDGGMSERTAASHFSQAARLSSGAGIIGRDVPATVGSRVVVLDPSLDKLVEPTGTIVEVRCDGGRVKVQHDSVDKAERYYSTGKDGHFQLGGLDDQRPRFSLPPPPSKVEARPEASSALPAAAQRRPRYSEVRRSMGGPRRVGNSQTADSSHTADAGVDETAALSRSNSVASVQTFQTAQTTAEAAQVAFDSSSRASSRPRYSELRKARASAVLAGQSAEAVDRMEASCASSMSNTGPVADISPRPRPLIGATADEAASGNHSLQPQARRRYSEQRRASRSPARPDVRQCGMDAEEGPAEGTTAGRSSCPPSNPAGPTAEEFSQLCRRLETLERDTASLASQLQSFREESLTDMNGLRDQGRQQAEAYERHWRDETRRHLEACEEHLRQRFREENRQQLEATEHRIFKNVMQEFEGQLRGAVAKLCASPQSPQSQFEAEEPEQEYETPGPEETIRVEKKVFDISRAELADSELSLQTIGSIARRVSASLGGESRSAASSSTPQRDAAEKRALQQMHRLPSSRNDRSPRTEPSFEQLEQEMERLADMRRYASQVLGAKSQELAGSRAAPGSASQPFDAWQAAEESPSREIKEPARRRTMPAAAPSPTFGRPETPGRTTSAERWKRRSSVQPEGAQAPACPWEEEQQLPASRVQWPADWQVDSQGRLIF